MPVSIDDLFSQTHIAIESDDKNVRAVTITTPRLVLRPVTEADISFYQEELWGNQQVMAQFYNGKTRFYAGTAEEQAAKAAAEAPYDYAKTRIKGWLDRWETGNVWSAYTICLRSSDLTVTEEQPIGHIIIGGGELAYFLRADTWNQGYMSEAAMALMSVAVPKLVMHPWLKEVLM